MPAPLLITILTFLALFLPAYSLLGLREREAARATSRLQAIMGSQGAEPGGREAGKRKSRRSLWLLRKALPVQGYQRLDQELSRAGLALRAEEFLGLQVAISLACGLLALLGLNPLMALALLLLGLRLPHLYLRRQQHRRRAKLNSQISDALVTVANALRSGFSFLQALDMVKKEMSDPIAREFGAALLEMNWGSSTEAALSALSERVRSDDLDLLVTAVLIQRQVGGNLAEILDNIALTIRERVRIKGEIRTLTAQGRISGLIIGLLPLALAAAIQTLNPGYLTPLFTTRPGLMLLASAVLGQLLGVFIIKRIISIEV